MILTTTNHIEHHKVVDYLGVVSGVTLKMRENVSAFTSDLNKYSIAMKKALKELKEEAFQELKDNAKQLGANAVIGIHIDFEPVGSTGSFFGVSVTGTAVKVAVANKAYESDDDLL